MTRRQPRARARLGLVMAHAVLIQALTFVVRPNATYWALEPGVPAVWLGVLGASFALAPLVLAVPCGRAVDRVGERRVTLAGAAAVCAAAAAFVLLGGGVAGLVAANLLLGTGHLASVVGEQALVANVVAPGRHDAAFGN